MKDLFLVAAGKLEKLSCPGESMDVIRIPRVGAQDHIHHERHPSLIQCKLDFTSYTETSQPLLFNVGFNVGIIFGVSFGIQFGIKLDLEFGIKVQSKVRPT